MREEALGSGAALWGGELCPGAMREQQYPRRAAVSQKSVFSSVIVIVIVIQASFSCIQSWIQEIITWCLARPVVST